MYSTTTRTPYVADKSWGLTISTYGERLSAVISRFAVNITPMTKEPQYAPCFDEPPVTLGPMSSSTFRWNPMRLGWYLARYKFVAKMLKGKGRVAEIGCGDGFASRVVANEVEHLDLYDFDPIFVREAQKAIHPYSRWATAQQHDIKDVRLPEFYDAIYMCDVIEHIDPKDEPTVMANIAKSLWARDSTGVFIAGAPSLESQAYATEISRAGHVNCRNGDQFKSDMEKYFHNVFMFSMNDEVVHTGDFRMAHYLFALCVGPR